MTVPNWRSSLRSRWRTYLSEGVSLSELLVSNQCVHWYRALSRRPRSLCSRIIIVRSMILCAVLRSRYRRVFAFSHKLNGTREHPRLKPRSTSDQLLTDSVGNLCRQYYPPTPRVEDALSPTSSRRGRRSTRSLDAGNPWSRPRPKLAASRAGCYPSWHVIHRLR